MQVLRFLAGSVPRQPLKAHEGSGDFFLHNQAANIARIIKLHRARCQMANQRKICSHLNLPRWLELAAARFPTGCSKVTPLLGLYGYVSHPREACSMELMRGPSMLVSLDPSESEHVAHGTTP